MVPALSIGTATAKDKPTDKEKGNGPEQVTYVFKRPSSNTVKKGVPLK